MRTRRTRILRSLGHRPAAAAGTWVASSESAPDSIAPGPVAGEHFVQPVGLPDVETDAPEALDAPGAGDLSSSSRSDGSSYPIQVARSAILAPTDLAHQTTDLRNRRQSRRRAIVLSGGVAAAVVGIVAVVVLALGQGSGTSPTATVGPNTSTSTSNQVTAASAAAVVVTTAEPVLPTVTTAAQTNGAQAPAAAPRTASPAPTTKGPTAVTTPRSTTPPAAAAGVHDTATVVTGVSKLTGWVPLSTPKP